MPTLCPACGSPIPADHISVQADTAACRACGHTTTLSSIVNAPALSVYSAPPDGCDVQSDGPRWRALASNRSVNCIPPIILAVLWNGLMAIFVGPVLLGRAPVKVLPLLSVHLAAGAFLIWVSLLGLIGTHEVIIERDTISVSNGVGPLRFTRRRPLSKIRGIRRTKSSLTIGRPLGTSTPDAGLELIAMFPLKFGTALNDQRRNFLHAVIAAELFRRQHETHPPTQPGPQPP